MTKDDHVTDSRFFYYFPTTGKTELAEASFDDDNVDEILDPLDEDRSLAFEPAVPHTRAEVNYGGHR